MAAKKKLKKLRLSSAAKKMDSDVVDAADLLREVVEIGAKTRAGFLERAARNEAWAAGDQWKNLDSDTMVLEDIYTLDGDTPKRNKNLMHHLGNQWVARVAVENPKPYCYPGQATAGDIAVAEMSNRILEYEYHRQEMDHKAIDLAIHAQNHSCAALVVTWNPLGGPKSRGTPAMDDDDLVEVDEDGNDVTEGAGDPLGAIGIDVNTIFDFWTDGAEHVEDAHWLCRQRLVTKWEAQEFLRRAGYKVNEVELEPHENIDVEFDKEGYETTVRCIPIYEVWHLPTARFPEGQYLVFVGDNVIHNSVYPYDHNELPLGIFKVSPRRGSPFGKTHVDDAVPIQQKYNEAISILSAKALSMQQEIRGLSADVYQQVVDEGVEDGDVVVSPESIIKWYTPPPVHERLELESQRAERDMFDVYGLSPETTSGNSAQKGVAGKTIAYADSLEGRKLIVPVRSLHKVHKRVARQILSLHQQFSDPEALAQVVGPDLVHMLDEFYDADLDGLDVMLQPAAGTALTRAARGEEAMLAVQEMGADPVAGAEMAQTGLTATVSQGVQWQRMAGQIEGLLAGTPVDPDPAIDPSLAEAMAVQAISANEGHPNIEALWQLRQTYAGMAAPAQEAAPQGAPVAPSQPGFQELI